MGGSQGDLSIAWGIIKLMLLVKNKNFVLSKRFFDSLRELFAIAGANIAGVFKRNEMVLWFGRAAHTNQLWAVF
jgi:hypothetical protein